MSFSSSYYANYLENTRITFDNLAKSPEIKERLVEYGYNDERIQEGMTLLDRVKDLFRRHLEKRQERAAKREQLRETHKKVFQEYCDHVRRLRLELRDDPQTRAELALAGRRERSQAVFIEQAVNFYNTALTNAEIAARIERFGVSAAKLNESLARLQEYLPLRSDYEKVAGECQHLVEERDKAVRLLRGWMVAFDVTCRVAFPESPQILEEIGIFVRNRPKPRPKGEKEGQEANDEPAAETADAA